VFPLSREVAEMLNALTRTSWVVLAVAGVALGPGASGAEPDPYPAENDLIEVMFTQESVVRLRDRGLVDLAGDALEGVDEALAPLGWHEWLRISPVSEERLDELCARGEANSGKRLYNLNNIYRLRVSEGEDVWAVARGLEALPGVYIARPVPLPVRPPLPDDYEPQQGYLDPATDVPSGIDAEYAWTRPGGAGAGVTVCDLEYDWQYRHNDVTKLWGSGLIAGTSDPFNDKEHGTAAVGALVSDDNGWGTTGICKDASLHTCGTFDDTNGWNVPGALSVAIDSLSLGDVILLEQQWDYTNGGGAFIPIEWWLDYYPNDQTRNGVYAAIELAIANGIHVVEAGGNGAVNMDNVNWYGDSGAIIVGAGGASTGPNADRQRLSFSSYGWRFNLQGWGENVVTTGYGYLYDDEGDTLYFTDRFDGTSSASPVVAGAVACCVGMWRGYGWDVSLLTPYLLRAILMSTGTPQDTSVYGNIGPRPNLLAADQRMFEQAIEWADATLPPLGDYGYRGNGVSWIDYDGDGDNDIYVSNNGYQNKLFRNDGGLVFTDASYTPLNDPGSGTSAVWGDYDNSGLLDVYVGNCDQANKLLRNMGGGNFSDWTVSPINDASCADGIAWVDYDNDGDVDIYVANYAAPNRLFRNDGLVNWVDVATGPTADSGDCAGVAFADYDDDGDQDLYLAKYYSGANRLIRNDGGGAFTDVTSGPLGDTGEGMGVAWGDYDNDCDLDLYLVNNGQDNKLFRNDGGGTFTDVTAGPLVGDGYDFGCAWGDYDNDGDLDLYITSSYDNNRLLRNEGGGVFVDRTSGPLKDPLTYSMGVAFADADGDGDLDLYVANVGTYDSSHLFENLIGSNNHWLHVDLVGTTSNAAGIGARVRIVAGRGAQIREVSGGSGFRSQDSLTAEFGLGAETLVDTLIVRWPSGNVDMLFDVAADQVVQITEGSTGIDGDVVADFRLHGSAPNPFRRTTEIQYDLPVSATVSLVVYDPSGRRVATLVDSEPKGPGRYSVPWDGRDDTGRTVASGVYFYRMNAGSSEGTGRVVFLR
jgi:hypothetical protein